MRIFTLLTLAALVLMGHRSREMPLVRAGQDHALFFAIDNYEQHPDFTNLNNPISDARAVAQELAEMYGFSTQVYENASRETIFSVLREWQSRSFGPDDQLFLFFSGHGDFDEFVKKGYFIPAGAPDRIDLTDLANIVTQISCEHILLAIDACYSGTIDQEIAFRGGPFRRPGANGDTARDRIISDLLRNHSRLLLTSGGKERTPDGAEHSPFTEAVLLALRSAYTQADGLCTYQDLLARLERVRPVPHNGEMAGHEGGSFVFVVKQAENLIQTSPTSQNGIRTELLAQLRFIKGGTFQIGCDDEDRAQRPIEVTLSDFSIQKYEVSNRDFAKFLNSSNYTIEGNNVKIGVLPIYGLRCDSGFLWKDQIHFSDGEFVVVENYEFHPVVMVTWFGAIHYCNWLSSQHELEPVYSIEGTEITAHWEHSGYRLPTAAEWEFAARDRGKDYQWAGNPSNTYIDIYANIAGDQDGFVFTAPVGMLQPNELGLHNMNGNVSEWGWDKEAVTTTIYRGPYINPRGSEMGDMRIKLGGSWADSLRNLKCDNVFLNSPGYRGPRLGFRIAKSEL